MIKTLMRFDQILICQYCHFKSNDVTIALISSTYLDVNYYMYSNMQIFILNVMTIIHRKKDKDKDKGRHCMSEEEETAKQEG